MSDLNRIHHVRTVAITNAQDKANAQKHQLMNLALELHNAGALKKAASLYRIIARLERWQNTP